MGIEQVHTVGAPAGHAAVLHHQILGPGVGVDARVGSAGQSVAHEIDRNVIDGDGDPVSAGVDVLGKIVGARLGDVQRQVRCVDRGPALHRVRSIVELLMTASFL